MAVSMENYRDRGDRFVLTFAIRMWSPVSRNLAQGETTATADASVATFIATCRIL